MEVGAHTRTHVPLCRCGAEQLAEEVGHCKSELQDLLGADVDQFCYPYGDHDDRVVAAVRAAGFQAATTTRRARARPGEDPWRLPRIAVKRHHALPQFAWRVLTGSMDRRG
jgi:peptidoglycan/xylan/chitin deacetylase (PgdA/CDA1 family)